MYAYPNNINDLKARGWNIQQVKTFQRYWITRLKPQFLNAKTRASTLEEVDLVLVR